MKMVYILSLVLVLLLSVSPANAAPPPDEIEKRKEAAPLQVTGEVKADDLVRDISEESGYPHQIREMQLQINKVIKKPDDSTLSAGDSLPVVYSYIPPHVEIMGGKQMDIAVGDQIEIWLTPGENGWKPAFGGDTVSHLTYADSRKEPISEPFGGDTVNHLTYVDSRKEPIAEPFTDKMLRYAEEHLEYTVLAGVLLFVGLSVMASRKISFRRNSR